MKTMILLAAVAASQSCTVALSSKGDFVATGINGGKLSRERIEDSGGVSGVSSGKVGTVREVAEMDAARAGILNVGGVDGITLSGAFGHDSIARELGRALKSIERVRVAGKSSQTLINGAERIGIQALKQ